MILNGDVIRRLDFSRELLSAEPLRLQDVAREACFSPFHFHRTFREFYGETPHEFLHRCRIDRAKSLLLTSDMTVSEISITVGYQSLGTFSTAFHTATGRTPTEFRREARRHFALGRLWSHRFVPTCYMREVRTKPQDFRNL